MESRINNIKYMKKTIDLNWIKKLEECTNKGLLRWPRNIRTSQVTNLHRLLITGDYWDTPIVINHVYDGVTTGGLTSREISKKTPKNMHIIDGAHRLSALKLFYRNKDNKTKCFKQTFAIYHDLSDEEERLIYEKWSKGIKQSNQDWIVINQDEVLLWQRIRADSNFPVMVSLSQNKSTILLRDIFNALGSSIMSDSKYNPRIPNFSELRDFNEEISNWIKKQENFFILTKFFKFFRERFGMEGKDNIFQKPNIFLPIVDIYLKNHNKVGNVELSRKFQKIMGNQAILEKSKLHSSYKLKIEIRKLMVDVMNKGCKNKLE